MTSRSKTDITWGLEAATKLVKAVRDAGGPIPERFLYPGDHAGYEKLRAWKDCMGDLVESVSFAFTLRDALPDLTDFGRANRRAKDLADIRAKVLRLKKKLEKMSGSTDERNEKTGANKKKERSDEPLLSRLDQALPDDFPGVVEFVTAMLEAVEKLQARMGALPPVQDLSTTPQELLVQSLADCYSSNFGADPSVGMIKTFANYHGPFPAFILAALEIAKEPLSPSTLTTALQRHFSG